MSAVATRERPVRGPARKLPPRRRPFDDRAATLEDSILGAWEGLVVEGRSACLVCGGEMTAESGRAACRSCGSSLD